MKTICIDCRYINGRPSGIAALLRALVEHLPDLAPDWHFKLLRHASLRRSLSNAANVTEVEVAAEPNGPASMWFLPQVVDLSDVDLFHAPSNILPRGLSIPCVTTVHDIMWLTDPQLCKLGIWGHVERLFYGYGIKRALHQSDAILTVSDATRGAIIDLKPELADRTYIALSGVSDNFHPRTSDRSELDRLGLSQKPYVLTVGQSAPYKNHEGAIRGFAAAFAERPEIDLVVVQRQGGRTSALKQLAQKLGIAERVRFLQPVAGDDLVTLYCGALALLHPSLCEGYGMPLAEAMACGCPVITSDISAMPEVTGGAALLVDPHNTASIEAALRRVVDEPELVRDMREKGFARAKELDWRDSAAAHLEAYKNVLASA